MYVEVWGVVAPSRCRDDKGASGSHDDRKDPVRVMMI